MERWIAYCGVDCSACADLKNGVCPSCRAMAWKDDDMCMPVKCCRDKAIAFCGACSTFPCPDMAEFYQESASHEDAYRRMLAVKREQL